MSRSRSSIEKKNSTDDVKNRKSFILQKKMSDKTLAAQNILLYMHNITVQFKEFKISMEKTYKKDKVNVTIILVCKRVCVSELYQFSKTYYLVTDDYSHYCTCAYMMTK